MRIGTTIPFLFKRFVVFVLSISIGLPISLISISPTTALARPKDYEKFYYYKVLDLDPIRDRRITINGIPTYSARELKGAYRRASIKYHPDRNPNNKIAEDKFKEVQTAWAVLRDSELKYRYDTQKYWNYTRGAEQNRVVTDPMRLLGGKVFNPYKELFIGQMKSMPAEMLVFMLASTTVGMSFAMLEGDWDKVTLIRDQLAEISSWMGFGTFAVGSGVGHFALGSLFGTFLSPGFIGQSSTVIGMGSDYVFRNIWSSEEFSKVGINWSEWGYAKNNYEEAKDAVENLEKTCGSGKQTQSCQQQLTEARNNLKQRSEYLQKYKNLYWDYTKKSFDKLKLTAKEKEQFAQDAGHLMVAGAITSQVMNAGHLVNKNQLKPFFKSVYNLVKGAPKSALPVVITSESAAGAAATFGEATSNSAYRFVVRNAANKVLWTSSLRASAGGVFGLFKWLLRFGAQRAPHLLAFLTVMELTGASWTDVAKTLQLKGTELWPSPTTFSPLGNNVENVVKAGTTFVERPVYGNYAQFETKISNYLDDWMVWNDSIIFSHVNEIYFRYEGLITQERIQKIKQASYINWFLDSFLKFKQTGKLDYQNESFKKNNEDGFVWHPDAESLAFKRELNEEKHGGYFTQFKKYYQSQLPANPQSIPDASLVEKVNAVRENYLVHARAELEAKIKEIQARMQTFELPYELAKALYGTDSVMRKTTWEEYDQLRAELKGVDRKVEIYTGMCARPSSATRQKDLCTLELPDLKKRSAQLTEQVSRFKKQNDLSLTQRIKEYVTGGRDIPIYKIPRSMMGELVGKYNYSESLDAQYRIFRDIYARYNLERTPYNALIMDKLAVCPELKTRIQQGVANSCVYDLADLFKKMAAFDFKVIFSAADSTLPNEYRSPKGDLQSFTTEFFIANVSNKVGVVDKETAQAIISWRFARIFSGLISEYILMPVRQQRMSRIETVPQAYEEYFVEPFAEVQMKNALYPDPAYDLSRDIRFADAHVPRATTIQPVGLMKVFSEENRIKVSVADLETLLTNDVAPYLDFRYFRTVDPYYDNALRQAEAYAQQSKNSLESFKVYLNTRFAIDQGLKIMVVRDGNPKLQKLGLRQGDILQFVDTIQDVSVGVNSKKEMQTNVLSRGNLKAWIENIKANKFPTAALTVLRAVEGFSTINNTRLESHNGQAGFTYVWVIEYDITGHAR